MRVIVLALLASLSSCSSSTDDVFGTTSDGGTDAAPFDDAGPTDSGTPAHERLYVGTGEYNGKQNWHGVLRFEDAAALDSTAFGPYPATSTIPIKSTTDSAGVKLNFAHGFYVWEARDEMYIATLFTRADNVECGPCDPMSPEQSGSVAVLSGISKADGPQKISRHLFGGDVPAQDATQINQPHGLWIDEGRDLLYVANTFGRKLLVFNSASTVSGNTPPSRILTSPKLGFPVFVFVEPSTDVMFIASMATPPIAPAPAILFYRNASNVDAAAEPDIRIMGPNTRLSAGNNQTTHNVWFDRTSKLLFVGHHTNEVLVYDLSKVDLENAGPMDLDLAPRVIDVSTLDADIPAWSVYGLFYVGAEDRLYVSTGHAMMGPSVGSPPNAVKVYDGVSSPMFSGREQPSRLIHWQNGNIYFPPQPLWVTRY